MVVSLLEWGIPFGIGRLAKVGLVSGCLITSYQAVFDLNQRGIRRQHMHNYMHL